VSDSTDSYVVATGNLVDGHVFHGPFDNANDAGDWAEAVFPGETWWTIQVLGVTLA
jgi:hypothetical protein